MGVTWTTEQKQVIELRDRDILVSAAAGSGKTAVLVERILSMLTDPERPVDIDRLLIMTFTRAAAQEMRGRLARALEDALAKDPDNEHLQRQTTLIHSARITTIDGFCSYLLSNYFHTIGLDPGYRVADEGELKLLKADVVRELLEDCYQQKREEFLEFIECYASGKTDEGIEEFILQLYSFSMSNPWPEQWLSQCMDAYSPGDMQELQKTPWMKLLWKQVLKQLQEAEDLTRINLEICSQADGPYMYEDAIRADEQLLLELKSAAGDYDRMGMLTRKPSFARLSAKKDPGVSDIKKELVKGNRDQVKERIKELNSQYFAGDSRELLQGLSMCLGPVRELIRLTGEFAERFAEKKRQKNLVDFTDMEHFALDILVKKEEGKLIPTQAARELSLFYEEILVDEYQDSNYVQELLMNMVSGWAKEKNNIFMVGDVKQSIYRFRLARPELFMEKFHNFTQTESAHQRIDLHKNFRSRSEVLVSANFIFSQIMGEELGRVEYDDDAALYPGAQFPPGNDPGFARTEVLLVEKDSEELEDEKNQTDQELEALAVAQKIHQIVGKERVLDKQTGQYRPARYGDIVILLRTMTGWSEVFSQVLAGQGIPAYTTSKTGYFSALEVVTLLNYLHVCDNPTQEIPLAAVLHSPIGGCTANEMAMIKAAYPQLGFYEAARAYEREVPEEKRQWEEQEESRILREKLHEFFSRLERIRDMVPYTPIHELILKILEETGYGDYVSALPPGEQRKANLNMLVEKAMDYEKTSYRGLFNFIRYIEHLQKYNVDFGEVNLAGDAQETVQLMSIHKSKGLEFPIVFASGMGKQFNFQDLNAPLVLHPDYGIGADVIDPVKRVKVQGVMKQVFRRQLLEESLGEELRVLYVALTRAKEKLILTGSIGKMEKQVQALMGLTSRKERRLSFGTLSKARNYWGWILPALARHKSMEEIYKLYSAAGNRNNPLYEEEVPFEAALITPKMLVEEEVQRQAGDEMRKACLESWDPYLVRDQELREQIRERFAYEYPWPYLQKLPVKITVSDLKKRKYQEEEGVRYPLQQEPETEEGYVPSFIEKKEETVVGAARGTAYHRAMECLDYSACEDLPSIGRQLDQMYQRGRLDAKMRQCLYPSVISRFLESPLGKRMKKAALAETLYREQPFVFRETAENIQDDWKSGETVLVQGIIDAFFEEGEELVLVDYKTDRVGPGEEEKLRERYKIQLDYYGEALERMTQKRVKEKWIYSFALSKAISI